MDNDVIIKAVEKLKNSQFKATAVKVELEASLNRGHNGREACEYCDEGYTQCNDCYGDGDYMCSYCDGEGYFSHDVMECEAECEEEHECDECNGSGRVTCEECDEGYNQCYECEGNWEGEEPTTEFGSELVCHEWIMERLAEEGLATYDDSWSENIGDYEETYWHPQFPLTFARFYNDGSVDSELTFTLHLEEPENIFLLPKVVRVFNELADAIGNGMNVSGAGMHMALLNDPAGIYPSSTNEADRNRFRNFRKSMQLLLPALYFLSSTNETSRALRYREPMIANDHKYSAIAYRNGSIEFRAFETCYDNPDNILDNIVVMSNCMRYWTDNPTPNGLEKITNACAFGLDNGNSLERFYITTKHIDLLNSGLQKLKPSYYTISELKQQRKFKVNKRHINSAVTKRKKEAEVEYKEYSDRFDWSIKYKRHNTMSLLLERAGVPDKSLQAKVIEQAEKEADKTIEELKTRKLSVDKYIEQKVQEWTQRSSGNYVLRAD